MTAQFLRHLFAAGSPCPDARRFCHACLQSPSCGSSDNKRPDSRFLGELCVQQLHSVTRTKRSNSLVSYSPPETSNFHCQGTNNALTTFYKLADATSSPSRPHKSINIAIYLATMAPFAQKNARHGLQSCSRNHTTAHMEELLKQATCGKSRCESPGTLHAVPGLLSRHHRLPLSLLLSMTAPQTKQNHSEALRASSFNSTVPLYI